MNTTPNLPPLSQTKEVTCSNPGCNSKIFNTVHLVREVSRFLFAPAAPEDVILPIPVLQCAECFEILQQSLPRELRQPNENNLRIIE